jgi:hypothetical protein
LFIAGCSKSDRESINGTWSFYELKGQDGKTMYSADKAEQKKITDKMVKEQLAMYAGAGIDEKMIRETFQKQFEAIGKVTFTFDNKGTVKVAGNGADKSGDTESKFTMDEKKKEVTIKSDEREMKYTYAFKDDKLVMKGTAEEFTLVKKS